MPPKNQLGREQLSKKARARYLIVVKGYLQKEAAALVGVSERSMTEWVKKYKWNEAKDKELLKLGGLESIMEGFLEYVKSKAPKISKDVNALWTGYLKEVEKGTLF